MEKPEMTCILDGVTETRLEVVGLIKIREQLKTPAKIEPRGAGKELSTSIRR
jgi:hypothetical protein